jgi:hypothetical protein
MNILQISRSEYLLGVILRQTKKHTFQEVFELVYENISKNIIPPPELVNNIFHYCELEKKFEEMVDFFGKLSNTLFVWNSGCLVIMIRIYYQMNDLDKMMEILDIISSKLVLRQRDISLILSYCSQHNKIIEGNKVWNIGKKYNVDFLEQDYLNIIKLSDFENIIKLLIEMSDIYPVISQDSLYKLIKITEQYNHTHEDCLINDNTRCSKCQVELLNYDFTDINKHHLLLDIENKLINEKDDRGIKNAFGDFKEFLNNISNVDIIIDGANVGYYGLNYRNPVSQKNIKNKGYVDSLVNYEQIKQMVEIFEKQNKKILIILHERHYNNIKINIEDKKMLEKWISDDKLYLSSKKLNDDICWMYASIYYTNPENNHFAHIISNDMMREHCLNIMNKKLFIMWKNMNQISYKINITDEKIIIFKPLSYAQKIQYYDNNNNIKWSCLIF